LAAIAMQACHGITVRQWAWATAIAVIFLLAYVVGLLPPMLRLVPNLAGPPPPAWGAAQSVGLTLVYIGAAYCFLIAVSIAEFGAGRTPTRRYVIAGICACVAAVIVENSLYHIAPSLAPRTGGWGVPMDAKKIVGTLVWSAANIGLSGGLALAVYVRLASARRARRAFSAAELDRAAAAREVLACRLASLQAQIEPQFLLGTLTQVAALYDRDRNAGDRMLDALIDYLHAALPQLRRQQSTLERETKLVERYLRVVQIRMGSRLDYPVDVRSEVGDCTFPPMLLLPLVDDALRSGLEPLTLGGTIAITANTDGSRLRVCVADDGLPACARSHDGAGMTTLRERLEGLYGGAASLEFTANEPHGVIAAIEVSHEHTRNHRGR